MLPAPKVRLYLDESGDHSSSCVTDIGKRYLGLVGVGFLGPAYKQFSSDLEALKRRHFEWDPDNELVLHRKEIVQAKGPFRTLLDPTKRKQFDNDLLQLLKGTEYHIIAIVIDKVDHSQKKYRALGHPYHYCLLAMLQRYCGRLNHLGQTGTIVAESRGKVEDRELQSVYANLHQFGGHLLPSTVTKQTLSSRALQVRKKEQNIPGLQLADLLAYPLTRDVLVAYNRIPDRGSPFSDLVANAVQSKYNKHLYDGRINGYGRAILS